MSDSALSIASDAPLNHGSRTDVRTQPGSSAAGRRIGACSMATAARTKPHAAPKSPPNTRSPRPTRRAAVQTATRATRLSMNISKGTRAARHATMKATQGTGAPTRPDNAAISQTMGRTISASRPAAYAPSNGNSHRIGQATVDRAKPSHKPSSPRSAAGVTMATSSGVGDPIPRPLVPPLQSRGRACVRRPDRLHSVCGAPFICPIDAAGATEPRNRGSMVSMHWKNGATRPRLYKSILTAASTPCFGCRA
jgi:hypothetical protein